MTCPRGDEVRGLLAKGHWPDACAAELREHVAGCRGCSSVVILMQGFGAARAELVARAKVAAPGLIFWRAQIRRRQAAMERVGKPIWTAQVFAVALSLCAAVGVGGWLLARGDWVQWNPEEIAKIFSLSSLLGGLGLAPMVACVAVLGLLGGLAVYLTVERE